MDAQAVSYQASMSGFLAGADCKHDLVEIAPAGIALGLVLWTCTALSIVPSITKPMKMKTTIGLSPWTLLLTNVQQTLTVVNTTMMKSPQIQMCFEDPWGCHPSLLAWYQTLTAWIFLFFVFPTVVWYPDPDTEETRARNQKLWRAQSIGCFGLVFVTTLWAMFTDCPSSVAVTGTMFGWGSSVLMIFRFLPQLITTCVARTAGSISYVTYLFLGVGGFTMTGFQIFVSKEHVSTWFPVFVGNVLQSIIIVTAGMYDYGPLRSCRGQSLEEKLKLADEQRQEPPAQQA